MSPAFHVPVPYTMPLSFAPLRHDVKPRSPSMVRSSAPLLPTATKTNG